MHSSGYSAHVFMALVLTLAFAPSARSQSESAQRSVMNPKEIESVIRQGIEASKAQHPKKALTLFDRVLPHIDGQLKTIVAFNRASCLFKLEQYSDAEKAFGTLALQPGRLAILASLNAGFAAAEQSRLASTLRWLEHARRHRSVLPERFELLKNQAASLAKAERASLASQAQIEFKAQRVDESQVLLRRALATDFGMEASEKAQLQRQIASVHAASSSQTSTSSTESEPMVSFWFGVSGGYDSNVGRASSHAGDVAFIGAGVGSPVTIKTAEIDWVFLNRRTWSLSTGYLYDLYAVLEADLEALSDHYHELEFILGQRLTPDLQLRSRLYGGVSAVGLSSPEIYQGHVSGQLRLRYFQSARSMTEFDFLGGRFFGSQDNEYLSGLHSRLDIGQHWFIGRFRIQLEARLRYRDGGFTEFELLSGDILACDQRCDGGAFRVTYAHIHPDFGLVTQYRGWSFLRPSVVIRGGYRHYLDDHFALDNSMTTIPESVKRRADVLVSTAVSLEWLMTKRWSTLMRYGFVYNQSNVDSSGDIDAHGWDYANKTFIQHTLELGVEYTYD